MRSSYSRSTMRGASGRPYAGTPSAEAAAVLPRAFDRLEFGVHRLTAAERWCAAWPRNPDAVRAAAYTRSIRKYADAISWPRCVECGGTVTAATGGERIHGAWDSATGTAAPDRFQHPRPEYRRGVMRSACLEFIAAHPDFIRTASAEAIA